MVLRSALRHYLGGTFNVFFSAVVGEISPFYNCLYFAQLVSTPID